MKFLNLLAPVVTLLPSISPPERFISIRQKTLMTAITLFIYLLCCQIPLYGIVRAEGGDPFEWMRVILASSRGTLMELGLSPIISAGLVLQFVVGLRLITADLSIRKDREMYEGLQKILALLIGSGQAVAYIFSGTYGPLEQIGAGNALLILLQLTISSFLVIMLDQMLQQYGLVSGISLFIAANTCQLIVWKTLSPITIKSQYGTEFEGSLIAFLHLLVTKPNKLSALYQALFRGTSSNILHLLATILVFFLVIYLQGFKVNIELVSKKYRGYTTTYPIKLFYTSTMSVVLQSTFVQNIYLISKSLHDRYRGSLIIRIIGTWQEKNGYSAPVGGLAYWISPPRDMISFFRQPLHSLVFTLFVMATCAFFSRIWLHISKQSANDVAKKFRDEQLSIKGQGQGSMVRYLNRYIPVAATCGGMCIGLITILSNLLGVIGSGTGILLAVSIIYECFSKISEDGKNAKNVGVF